MVDTSTVTNYKGEATEVDCLGCARENGVIERVGTVLTTQYFDAHQDFEVPIRGFIIISARRHVTGIDKLEEKEQQDLLQTIVRVRQGLREALGIETVYLFQNEDSRHHFHMWIFPRYPWMQEQFGQKIESVRPIMRYARENLKTSENLAEIETALEKLHSYLLNH